MSSLLDKLGRLASHNEEWINVRPSFMCDVCNALAERDAEIERLTQQRDDALEEAAQFIEGTTTCFGPSTFEVKQAAAIRALKSSPSPRDRAVGLPKLTEEQIEYLQFSTEMSGDFDDDDNGDGESAVNTVICWYLDRIKGNAS